MSTPNPQDLFSRYMAMMFDERKIIGVPTAFQSFFGDVATGAETHYSPNANVVEIDIIRGNERTAALIPRGSVSRSLGTTQKNTRSEQFSSFARKYPLAEEEGDITADQLTNRLAGESSYGGVTKMERLRALGLNKHMESVRRHVRLFEVLSAQSILTGKQDAVTNAGSDDQYDFRRNSAHTVTVGTSWLVAPLILSATWIPTP